MVLLGSQTPPLKGGSIVLLHLATRVVAHAKQVLRIGLASRSSRRKLLYIERVGNSRSHLSGWFVRLCRLSLLRHHGCRACHEERQCH